MSTKICIDYLISPRIQKIVRAYTVPYPGMCEEQRALDNKLRARAATPSGWARRLKCKATHENCTWRLDEKLKESWHEGTWREFELKGSDGPIKFGLLVVGKKVVLMIDLCD